MNYLNIVLVGFIIIIVILKSVMVIIFVHKLTKKSNKLYQKSQLLTRLEKRNSESANVNMQTNSDPIKVPELYYLSYNSFDNFNIIEK